MSQKVREHLEGLGFDRDDTACPAQLKALDIQLALTKHKAHRLVSP
jgi:hypothetical protein